MDWYLVGVIATCLTIGWVVLDLWRLSEIRSRRIVFRRRNSYLLRSERSDRGMVVVEFAVMLPLWLALFGLLLDGAILAHRHNLLNRAAEGAASAGAISLCSGENAPVLRANEVLAGFGVSATISVLGNRVDVDASETRSPLVAVLPDYTVTGKACVESRELGIVQVACP